MTEEIDDEIALATLFDPTQQLAVDIEDGGYTSQQLQERLKIGIKNLQRLTHLVNKLHLFSSNELIDDVPTDSLQFLMIPCFLGIFHQNLIAEPTEKVEELQKSIVYFRNFLERLRNLTLIESNLQWEEEGSSTSVSTKKTPEEARRLKLERHNKKKELKQTELRIKKQLEAVAIDDGNLRDLYITQMQYWAERAFEELQCIDEELPLLKMMAERAKNPQNEPPTTQKRVPMKPFVITRDVQQKQVFGLGYPGVPTMTVDEWYHNKFGHGGGPSSANQPEPSHHGEAPHSDEEDDDEKRARQLRWDEYKDDHRRGWGNTHNKG